MWHTLAWLQVFVAVAGLILAVAALRRRWPRTWAFVQAAVVAVSSAALAIYVAGDDDYRRNGVSRWEAYDAELVTVAAVAAGAVAGVLLLAAVARDGSRLSAGAALLSVVAAALTFAAYFANTLN